MDKFFQAITFIAILFIPSPSCAQQLNLNHDTMCHGRMDGFLFQDHQNCHMFYRCENGRANHRTCPTGTLFHLNLFFCVAEHSVVCGSRSKPGVIQQPTIRNPPSHETHHQMCRNQPDGTRIENPTNCRAFVQCESNLRLDRECSSGELYDSHLKECMKDFVVNCGDRALLPAVDDLEFQNICVGVRNNERIENPHDCRSYFECFNEHPQVKECNQGLLFEVSSRMCIPEFVVNCGRRKSPIANKTPVLDVNLETMCRTLPSGTRFSNPDDCGSFFECDNGRRSLISCTERMHFDINTNQCRDENLVQCSGRSRSTQADICRGKQNGVKYQNPLNCGEFIECQNNQRIDRTCQAGQLFNIQLNACTPAETVNCGSRKRPQSGDLITGIQTPCSRSGIYISPHPQRCQSSYFICINGAMIQHNCASGIVFNPDTLQCDFPQNVGCLSINRPSPQIPRVPDCSNGQSFYPHLIDCTRYYLCIEDRPHLMLCGTGYYWENTRARCEPIADDSPCARRNK